MGSNLGSYNDLVTYNQDQSREIATLRAEVERLTAENAKLMKALEELRDLIGGHEGWCASDMQDGAPCQCGYQITCDALDGKGGG